MTRQELYDILIPIFRSKGVECDVKTKLSIIVDAIIDHKYEDPAIEVAELIKRIERVIRPGAQIVAVSYDDTAINFTMYVKDVETDNYGDPIIAHIKYP